MAGTMGTDPITSSDNRWLKRLRKAASTHDDEILLEGPKQVDDALESGLNAIAVFVREGRDAPTGCDPDRTHVVAERAFRSLGDTKTSQGVLALFERPRHTIEEILESPGGVVAVDGVQDPGNVGAIVRLAAAFDLAGVITLSGSADPFSPRAVRGSAGSVLTVRVAGCSPRELVELCAKMGRRIFAAMPSGPSVAVTLPGNAVAVLGSEGRGVSSAIVDAGTPFSIPTSGRVESLNVATAAAITLWEMARSGRK
jgi:TrmH family RNA methyltransferase